MITMMEMRMMEMLMRIMIIEVMMIMMEHDDDYRGDDDCDDGSGGCQRQEEQLGVRGVHPLHQRGCVGGHYQRHRPPRCTH